VKHCLYFEKQGQEESRSVLSPPCILTHCNASTLHTGIDRVAPVCKQENIEHITNGKPYVMHEVPDGHKANKRKTLNTAKNLPPHGFHSTYSCCVHVSHLIIEEGTDEKKLVGDIHAVQFISHVTSIFNRSVAAARAWLRKYLQLQDGFQERNSK